MVATARIPKIFIVSTGRTSAVYANATSVGPVSLRFSSAMQLFNIDNTFAGETCDCDESSRINNVQQCIQDSSTKICSDRGDCVCGECFCDDGYNGAFCECSACDKVIQDSGSKVSNTFCTLDEINFFVHFSER